MTEATPAELFDPGMQPERTALAWRRTSLSIAAGSIVALRIFPLTLGPWAIAPGALALALAGGLFAASHVRYRRNHRAMISARDQRATVALAGGALLAFTAAVALALGAIAAVILIATELKP